jgi:hypothetical protein
MDAINSTPIFRFSPTSTSLRPPQSSKPILAPGYELRPCLINLIRKKSFSGVGDANPHSHLREFEQTYVFLRIAGMSDETLRWKPFLFSLTGKAKQWYNRTVGSVQGDWKTLCSKFYLEFFPISRVVNL